VNPKKVTLLHKKYRFLLSLMVINTSFIKVKHFVIMKNWIKVVVGTCSIFVGSQIPAWAQIPTSPNCPPSGGNSTVQINGSNTSTCGAPVNLSAIAFVNYATTDSYTVSNVPYTPFPYVGANFPQTGTAGTLLQTADDVWSTSIAIPFPFCFFGTSYTSLLIGSNANITFNPANLGAFNAYNFVPFPAPVPPSATPMPNSNATLNNSICIAQSDIHPQPNTGCSITWQVYGTAPCRAFVVSWDSVGYFNATGICGASRTTCQAVLYENTNIIDMNIHIKQNCLSNGTNQATAYQGIQNDAGTIAYTTPGRNGPQWTDTNSTWRYTPAGTGANSYTFVWKNLTTGATIGSGQNITVNPLTNTDYEVTATFGCSGASLKDTFTVTVSDPVVADFTPDVHLGCDNDTIRFTNTSINSQTYQWSFGDGQFSVVTNPNHVYQNQGLYNIAMIATNGNCKDTVIKPIDLRHPINAAFATSDSLVPNIVTNKFCLSDPINGVTVRVINQSIGGKLNSKYELRGVNGVLQTKFSNNILFPQNFNIKTAGNYTIALIVTDTLGCVDSAKQSIFVDPTPFADFTVSDSSICIGEASYFIDTIPSFAQSFVWNFGDLSSPLFNTHDPQHTFSLSNTYNVSLTATFLVCPPFTVTKTVEVVNFPIIDLGPDSSICPGVTAPINLTTGNPSTLWSTGYTGTSITTSAPGTYWAQISNKGCTNADTVEIKRDCFINIPNSFTPNSADGLNSTFMASNLWSGVLTYSLDIYNRWGEKIFTTTNLNSNGWDGKYGGKDQPMGVYVYQMAVVFANGERKTYTGNVTLIR
jgi:gliding motility-associated-like protein